MRVAVLGALILAGAFGCTMYGLWSQAKEIERLRGQVRWAKGLTTALVEDEARRQRAEERKVVDFLR